MQTKFSKTIRSPSRNFVIQPRDIEILHTIASYLLIPTSYIVRLIPGSIRKIKDRLTLLWRAGWLNRFPYPRPNFPGEEIYFPDNPEALALIAENMEGINPELLPWQVAKRNRERPFTEVDRYGRFEYTGRIANLSHELDISRQHFMLDMESRKPTPKMSLTSWRQDPGLKSKAQASVRCYDPARKLWYDGEQTETLPHEPDALFTITISATGEQRAFSYERERATKTNLSRLSKFFRSRFEYTVKQRKHKEELGVPSIHACLVECKDTKHANKLISISSHQSVIPKKPTPFFWFTSSEFFTQSIDPQSPKFLPRYLYQPEWVLNPIWATGADTRAHSIIE